MSTRINLIKATGSNGLSCDLVWATDFESRKKAAFTSKQKYVDSEVLRLCSPKVPRRTGTLDRSGTLGTEIGSGEVRYVTPYARVQYYNTALTRPYDHNRGAKWFERMKAESLKDILDGAKKVE